MVPPDTMPMGKFVPDIGAFLIIPEFLEVFDKFDISLPGSNDRKINQALGPERRHDSKGIIPFQNGLFDSRKNPGSVSDDAYGLVFGTFRSSKVTRLRNHG
jgi:hypothetical protein